MVKSRSLHVLLASSYVVAYLCGVEVDMNSHQDDHMKRGDKDMVGGWSHVLREEDPPWHSEWTAAAAPSSASSSSASACPPSS